MKKWRVFHIQSKDHQLKFKYNVQVLSLYHHDYKRHTFINIFYDVKLTTQG